MFLEHEVMNQSSDWLDDDYSKQDETNDRMCRIELERALVKQIEVFRKKEAYLLQLSGQIDTKSGSNDIHNVCHDLYASMHPDQTRKAEQANQDGTKREENDKSYRRHDPMCKMDLIRLQLTASKWLLVVSESGSRTSTH